MLISYRTPHPARLVCRHVDLHPADQLDRILSGRRPRHGQNVVLIDVHAAPATQDLRQRQYALDVPVPDQIMRSPVAQEQYGAARARTSAPRTAHRQNLAGTHRQPRLIQRPNPDLIAPVDQPRVLAPQLLMHGALLAEQTPACITVRRSALGRELRHR
jgi:hypothetical protein